MDLTVFKKIYKREDMKPKVTSYSNANSEGVNLHFDKKVAMNGSLKSDNWFVSWEKIADALLK